LRSENELLEGHGGASWDSFNHYGTKPIFEGADTIAFAREVFGISNPDDEQLSLF
jgi:hypothetical protein